MFWFKRLTKFKFLIIFGLFLFLYLIYIEFFTYATNNKKWLNIKCDNREKCLRILLVADPQIIGVHNEIMHFLTPLSIFDSDRYIKKTYTNAFEYVQPDVVIFLGDLMDEGFTATDNEFYQYVRRVFNLFFISDNSHVRHIWLPGDNDIGGEDSRVKPVNVKRFNRAFLQPDLITIRNITFFKINILTSSMPVFKERRDYYDTNRLFIGLSHIPLLFRPTPFVDKVLNKMLPQLIFSAHEHKSMIIKTDALLREDRHITPVTPDNAELFEYSLSGPDIYEIIVPTCSYRMGTDKIGFGFAVIEGNNLSYTVLWSPSRFQQLFNYLILLLICLLIGLYFLFCKICFRR